MAHMSFVNICKPFDMRVGWGIGRRQAQKKRKEKVYIISKRVSCACKCTFNQENKEKIKQFLIINMASIFSCTCLSVSLCVNAILNAQEIHPRH